MAVQVNETRIFTVKYLDEEGSLQFLDLPAVGMTEAKDIFAQKYPNCSVVNIWRRQ